MYDRIRIRNTAKNFATGTGTEQDTVPFEYFYIQQISRVKKTSSRLFHFGEKYAKLGLHYSAYQGSSSRVV